MSSNKIIIPPVDGPTGRPGGDISLPAAPSGVDSIAVDLPLQFDLFELASTGSYTFLLHIDGAAVGAAQLNVRQLSAA